MIDATCTLPLASAGARLFMLLSRLPPPSLPASLPFSASPRAATATHFTVIYTDVKFYSTSDRRDGETSTLTMRRDHQPIVAARVI
jgi:hypothetical protein